MGSGSVIRYGPSSAWAFKLRPSSASSGRQREMFILKSLLSCGERHTGMASGDRGRVSEREPDQRRHRQQYQRKLDHEAGDDRDGERLLDARAMADGQGERQQSQD